MIQVAIFKESLSIGGIIGIVIINACALALAYIVWESINIKDKKKK
jgi:multidrug transporter EmrE-like cation transporter